MGVYQDQAQRAGEKIQDAIDLLNNQVQSGNSAVSSIANNKDSLASGIIESNKKISEKCDAAVRELTKFKEDIMNKAIEIDNRIEAEKKEKEKNKNNN